MLFVVFLRIPFVEPHVTMVTTLPHCMYNQRRFTKLELQLIHVDHGINIVTKEH
jgi:hypothetical protein